MTSISVFDDRRNIVIIVRGHTETRVCAAISFMMQVFAQCLLDREIDAEIDMDDDGYMRIDYYRADTGIYDQEIDSKYDMLMTGFDMLEDQHPESVSLILTG